MLSYYFLAVIGLLSLLQPSIHCGTTSSRGIGKETGTVVTQRDAKKKFNEIEIDSTVRAEISEEVVDHLLKAKLATCTDKDTVGNVVIAGDNRAITDVIVRRTGNNLYVGLERPLSDEWMELPIAVIPATTLKLLRCSNRSTTFLRNFTANRLKVIASTACSIHLLNINVTDLEVEAEGESTIVASGRVKNQRVNMEGKSTYNAFELKAETSYIITNEASQAYTRTKRNLTAQADEESTIQYRVGGLHKVIVNQLGSGTIQAIFNW